MFNNDDPTLFKTVEQSVAATVSLMEERIKKQESIQKVTTFFFKPITLEETSLFVQKIIHAQKTHYPLN